MKLHWCPHQWTLCNYIQLDTCFWYVNILIYRYSINLLIILDNLQVSLTARQLIHGLLHRDPANRLGSNGGANEIKQHPFFRGISWPLIRYMVTVGKVHLILFFFTNLLLFKVCNPFWMFAEVVAWIFTKLCTLSGIWNISEYFTTYHH